MARACVRTVLANDGGCSVGCVSVDHRTMVTLTQLPHEEGPLLLLLLCGRLQSLTVESGVATLILEGSSEAELGANLERAHAAMVEGGRTRWIGSARCDRLHSALSVGSGIPLGATWQLSGFMQSSALCRGVVPGAAVCESAIVAELRVYAETISQQDISVR